MATLEGEIADFAVMEYNANPQFIENIFAKGEAAGQAFIVGVLKNIKAGGLAGVILGYVENGEAAFAAQLIAKYSPQELYTLLGTYLAAEAKRLGG